MLLQELLTNKKYRKFSLEELENLIDDQLHYYAYDLLKGKFAIDKAKRLKEYWSESND